VSPEALYTSTAKRASLALEHKVYWRKMETFPILFVVRFHMGFHVFTSIRGIITIFTLQKSHILFILFISTLQKLFTFHYSSFIKLYFFYLIISITMKNKGKNAC